MNKEKQAKLIIEEILGYKLNNYIGVKRENENNDDDTNKKNKSHITKFSKLSPHIDKEILSFLDVDKDKKDILKYGMINKTKFHNFNYNTNVSYGKLLLQSIIYDAKDVSRSIVNGKFTIDTENIINLKYDVRHLKYDIFLDILKKKNKDKNQLIKLEVNMDLNEVINILSMFKYIKNLKELIISECIIERNVFEFYNLKSIKFYYCVLMDSSELNKLQNLENFKFIDISDERLNHYEILKNISKNNTLKKFKSSNYYLNEGGFEYLQNIEKLSCKYNCEEKIKTDLKYLKKLKSLKLKFVDDINILNDIYKSFPTHLTNLKKLYIYFNFDNDNENEEIVLKFLQVIGGFQNLIEYRQFNGQNKSDYFSGLLNLEKLEFFDVKLLNRDFRNINNFDASKIKELIFLYYKNNAQENTFPLFSNIKNLNILKTNIPLSMNEITPLLQNIKDLNLYGNQKYLTDDVFKYMPTIHTLEIYNSVQITDKGIIYLLKNSKDLTFLYLNGNNNITDKIFNYIDNLTYLNLDNIKNIKKYNNTNKTLKTEIKIDGN